jgi:hypothetical protein
MVLPAPVIGGLDLDALSRNSFMLMFIELPDTSRNETPYGGFCSLEVIQSKLSGILAVLNANMELNL